MAINFGLPTFQQSLPFFQGVESGQGLFGNYLSNQSQSQQNKVAPALAQALLQQRISQAQIQDLIRSQMPERLNMDKYRNYIMAQNASRGLQNIDLQHEKMNALNANALARISASQPGMIAQGLDPNAAKGAVSAASSLSQNLGAQLNNGMYGMSGYAPIQIQPLLSYQEFLQQEAGGRPSPANLSQFQQQQMPYPQPNPQMQQPPMQQPQEQSSLVDALSSAQEGIVEQPEMALMTDFQGNKYQIPRDQIDDAIKDGLSRIDEATPGKSQNLAQDKTYNKQDSLINKMVSSLQDAQMSASIKKNTTAQILNQRHYSELLDDLVDRATPNMVVAIKAYSGLDGKARLLKDRAKSLAKNGKATPELEAFDRTVGVATKFLSNEIIRSLGEAHNLATADEIKKLSNPIYWNKSPELALAQWDELVKNSKRVSKTLSHSTAQTRDRLRDIPEEDE